MGLVLMVDGSLHGLKILGSTPEIADFIMRSCRSNFGIMQLGSVKSETESKYQLGCHGYY